MAGIAYAIAAPINEPIEYGIDVIGGSLGDPFVIQTLSGENLQTLDGQNIDKLH